MPRKYRWLTEGEIYVYGPKTGKGADERRGQWCEVVTLPSPGSRPANVLVRFADGVRHVVPSGVLRAIRLEVSA